jgi:hypothetical protein
MLKNVVPVLLILLSFPGWVQAQTYSRSSNPICGKTYTVTGSRTDGVYTLSISGGPQPKNVKLDKKKDKKKSIKDNVKDELDKELREGNDFGNCPADAGIILDFIEKFEISLAQIWFPDYGVKEVVPGGKKINEDNHFELLQSNADHRYTLELSQRSALPVKLVYFDTTNLVYVIDTTAVNSSPLIRKNFDKFLSLYKDLPSDLKPFLYLQQQSDGSYMVVSSLDEDIVGPTITRIPAEMGARLLGHLKTLKSVGNPFVVYTIRSTSDTKTPSKTNDDPKFKEN